MRVTWPARSRSFRTPLVFGIVSPSSNHASGLSPSLAASTATRQSCRDRYRPPNSASSVPFNDPANPINASASQSRRRIINRGCHQCCRRALTSDRDDKLCDAGGNVTTGFGTGRIRSTNRTIGTRRHGKFAGGNYRDIVYSASCVCSDSRAAFDCISFTASIR